MEGTMFLFVLISAKHENQSLLQNDTRHFISDMMRHIGERQTIRDIDGRLYNCSALEDPRDPYRRAMSLLLLRLERDTESHWLQ